MGKLLDSWLDGVEYLFTDDLISFYTFFNIILAECAYLWGFQSIETAAPFSFILIGYIVTILVFAWLKGNYEGSFLEKVCAQAYILVFAIFFMIGCIINAWMCIALTAIPLSITFLWIQIRNFQDTVFIGHCPKIVQFVSKLFANKIFYIFSMIVVILGPFITLVVFVSLIPTLSTTLKIVIPLIWFLCSPFLAYIEDEFAACNIFEIAYDITWNLEDEEYYKNMTTNNKQDSINHTNYDSNRKN